LQNIQQRIISSENQNKGFAMIISEETVERRAHKRFPVQDGIYAVLRNNSSKLGQIKNISKGGLAFSYIADEEQLHESFLVDIFIRNIGYYLKDVPSRKISDFHIDNRLPFSTFKVRQVGIQFNELAHSQRLQLDNFIRDHIMDGPI
jgi:hypothetical protein